MVAAVDKPIQQMVLPGISWDTFEKILADVGERHFRLTYWDEELEFMTLSYEHESFAEWIGKLISFAATELSIPLASGGSTTLKTSLRKAGLEPDRCYWVEHEKDMRGKKTWNALKNPPPDLAVEVDITRSSLDRLKIYAALQVPEVWRFDGETFTVLILGSTGKYKERTKSAAFPTLPISEFVRFIRKLGSDDESKLLRDFVGWLRSDVLTKKNGGRANGKNAE